MNRKELIKIIGICIISIIIAVSITLVIVNRKKDGVINDVSIEQKEDIHNNEDNYKADIRYYLNNSIVDTMPSNNNKYVSSNCNNDANINFDSNKWTYDVVNVTKEGTECDIYFLGESKMITITFDYNGGIGNVQTRRVEANYYFGMLPEPTYENHHFVGWYTEKNGGKEVTFWDSVGDKDITIYAHYDEYSLLTEKMDTLIKKDNSLVKVGNDYRYSGKSVNNYINIPDMGVYRIVGVFDGDIKVISDKPEEQGKAWNNRNDSNKWELSYLYFYLNNDLYNGLNDNLKKIIKKHEWYVGQVSDDDSADDAYKKEQLEHVNANIGLISTSDYAYAAEEGCWNKSLIEYDNGCSSKNWLYNNMEEWTINPSDYDSRFALHIGKTGFVSDGKVGSITSYRLSFYLNDKVKIINSSSADGSSSHPYEIVF